MNMARLTLSTLAGFIFVFIFDFIFHGKLLLPLYIETAELWRSEEEMQDFFVWGILSQLAYTAVLAFMFTRKYENKGLGEGIRFGLMFGMLLGVAQFGIYPYMPIPLELALAWVGCSILQITGLGAVFSLTYKE